MESIKYTVVALAGFVSRLETQEYLYDFRLRSLVQAFARQSASMAFPSRNGSDMIFKVKRISPDHQISSNVFCRILSGSIKTSGFHSTQQLFGSFFFCKNHNL